MLTPETRVNTVESTNGTSLIDLADIALTQDFTQQTGVRKILNTVPVRKPDRQWFVRTRSGGEWKLQTQIIEIKEDREIYLVDKSLWPDLAAEVIPFSLSLAITRQNVLFIWPIRLPGPDGRHDSWNQSALEAAKRAEDHWIRVAANMSLGAYELFEAAGALGEPEWPKQTFQDIINIAFKQRHITSLDHPVVRKLRGEI